MATNNDDLIDGYQEHILDGTLNLVEGNYIDNKPEIREKGQTAPAIPPENITTFYREAIKAKLAEIRLKQTSCPTSSVKASFVIDDIYRSCTSNEMLDLVKSNYNYIDEAGWSANLHLVDTVSISSLAQSKIWLNYHSKSFLKIHINHELANKAIEKSNKFLFDETLHERLINLLTKEGQDNSYCLWQHSQAIVGEAINVERKAIEANVNRLIHSDDLLKDEDKKPDYLTDKILQSALNLANQATKVFYYE